LFQAAKENNTYAFGVNTNQNSVDPDHIAGSMIKKVDVAAYEAIKSVVDGTFSPGTRVLSMADGGVDLVTEVSNVKVSAAVTQKLDELRGKIASGEIVVPSTVSGLEEFVAALK
jgi:basic membrane protein A